MTAGTIVFLIIWLGCSLIFVGVGIASGKSKKPVGINTSEKVPKPEEFTDVIAYNLAHRNLWFLFAGIFDIGGILFILIISFWNGNKTLVTVMTVLMFFFIFADVFMVEVVHRRLLEKYRGKNL